MSLMDAVVEQKVSCKVPGCQNTWTLGAQEIVDNWKHNNYHPPKRMCPSCRRALKTFQPVEVPCATKSCTHLLLITPYQQLILEKKGRSLPQKKHFCENCQALLKFIKGQTIPCRLKGCSNTWTWYASSQLKEGGVDLTSKPDPRLCPVCFQLYRSLTPQAQSCRIHSCERTWELDRMTQLAIQINFRKHPKRMCPPCNTRLKELLPQEVKCSVAGCHKTWTWSVYSQLEYEAKKQKDPNLPPPQRYCSSCFYLSNRLTPSTLACKKPTCPHTVEYTIKDQLEDIVQKKNSSHRLQFCKTCQEFYQGLGTQEVNCKQEGCDRQWYWRVEEQFDTSFYEEGHVIMGGTPSRYCERCHEYLHNRSDLYVNCQQCQTPILWTSRQQLMTALQLWVAPHLCPSCLKSR